MWKVNIFFLESLFWKISIFYWFMGVKAYPHRFFAFRFCTESRKCIFYTKFFKKLGIIIDIFNQKGLKNLNAVATYLCSEVQRKRMESYCDEVTKVQLRKVSIDQKEYPLKKERLCNFRLGLISDVRDFSLNRWKVLTFAIKTSRIIRTMYFCIVFNGIIPKTHCRTASTVLDY